MRILETLVRSGAALASRHAQLVGRLPTEPAAVAAFEPDTVVLTDSMLKRFEQHVDAFRAAARTVVRLLGEEDRYRTVRQAVDRLASLGVVPDPGRLMDLIELRNRTAHAYAPESEKQARILNAVFGAVPELLDLTARLARFVREQKLLPPAAAPVLAEAEALAHTDG